MAAKLRKQVLKVGTYHSPDGAVEVTPSRLKHWESEFARLSSNGYDVPVSFDHGSTVETLTPVIRNSAKNTVGQLKHFAVLPDGQSAEIHLDISDPRGAEQAESNRVYVSPVILPKWKDGKGNAYEDVLTHFDLVNHPVDHSQTPFTRLSLDAAAKALGPVRFSLDKENDVEDSEETSEDSPPKDTEQTPPVAPDQPEEAEGDNEMLAVQRIIGLLRGQGKPIADASDVPSFLVALEKVLASPAPEQGTPSAPQASVAEPNAQMLSLQRQVDSLYREKIERRLQDLRDSGRCTPAEFDAKKPGIAAVRMSLDDKGTQQHGALEIWIAHREELPAHSLAPKSNSTTATRLSADGVVEPPANSLIEKPVIDYGKLAAERRKSAGFMN